MRFKGFGGLGSRVWDSVEDRDFSWSSFRAFCCMVAGPGVVEESRFRTLRQDHPGSKYKGLDQLHCLNP